VTFLEIEGSPEPAGAFEYLSATSNATARWPGG